MVRGGAFMMARGRGRPYGEGGGGRDRDLMVRVWQ